MINFVYLYFNNAKKYLIMKEQEQKPSNPDLYKGAVNVFQDRVTLRDYYAGQALLGFISNSDYGIFDGTNEVHIPSIKQCYNISDAMLKQREL